MTSDQIKEQVVSIKEHIHLYQRNVDYWKRELTRLQEDCPHTNTQCWSNNDGDGQFKVEKCLDCGLQKDGGL